VPAKNLRALGERGLVALVRKMFPPSRPVLLGIGDDAAWVEGGGRKLLTTDLLLEGFDFTVPTHPPRLLGRKSLAVNLSDIAAMGGRPGYALLGLGLPDTTPFAWLREFLLGFREASRKARVLLAGGDLSAAKEILISVAVVGDADRIVTRSGARPGDLLFVSGTLGDAAAGLRLIQKGVAPVRRGRPDASARLRRAFLDPTPRLALGRKLAQKGLATSMIDLSDGLSLDLARLCEASGVRALVEAKEIPLSESLRNIGGELPGADPLALALHGGEDFELLFTAPVRKEAEILKLGTPDVPVARIGRIIRGHGVFIRDAAGKRRPLPAAGFDHFRPVPKRRSRAA
jgi:thiamine-monophosphate kinase